MVNIHNIGSREGNVSLKNYLLNLTLLIIGIFFSTQTLPAQTNFQELINEIHEGIIHAKIPEPTIPDSCPVFQEIIFTNDILVKFIKNNIIPCLRYDNKTDGELRIILKFLDSSRSEHRVNEIFYLEAYSLSDDEWNYLTEKDNIYSCMLDSIRVFIIDETKDGTKQIKKLGKEIKPDSHLWKTYNILTYENNPQIIIKGYIQPNKLEIIEGLTIPGYPFLIID